MQFFCFVKGAAFTRFQTLRLQKVFPQVLSQRLISYGSCQFPTLGFVVERFKARESFQSEKFWKIEGLVLFFSYYDFIEVVRSLSKLMITVNTVVELKPSNISSLSAFIFKLTSFLLFYTT